MTYKKLPVVFLFLLSSAVIAIGGYQCSTRVVEDKSIPIVNNNPVGPSSGNNNSSGNNGFSGGDPYYNPDNIDRLPDEPDDSCARKQYRELAEELGEMAVFKIDQGKLRDFNMGARTNFAVKCPRLYLSMSEAGSNVYQGELAISYEADGQIYVKQFSSGYGERENKYNRWRGRSWKEDRNDKVDKKFYAIFESESRAVILKVEDVRLKDLRDGGISYYGAGELYYKMFRVLKQRDEKCLSGTYVSQSNQSFPRRDKCWFISSGAYNCLPMGAIPPHKGKLADAPDIDLAGALPCYSRLGRFFGLEIKQAFSVSNVNELD